MSVLSPMNRAIVGDIVIGPDRFVPGSGTFRISGKDRALTMVDGRTRHVRSAVVRELRFEAGGDFRSLNALTSETGARVRAFSGEIALADFTGYAVVTYDPDRDVSAVRVSGE